MFKRTIFPSRKHGSTTQDNISTRILAEPRKSAKKYTESPEIRKLEASAVQLQ